MHVKSQKNNVAKKKRLCSQKVERCGLGPEAFAGFGTLTT